MRLKITEKYTVFSLIFTAAVAVALFFPLNLPLKAVLAIGYFASVGYLVGTRLMPHESRPWRAFFGFLAVVAGLVVVGSIVYYFYRLDLATVAVLLLLPPLVLLLPGRKRLTLRELISSTPPRQENSREDGQEAPRPAADHQPLTIAASLMLGAIAIGLILYGLIILQGSATDISIRSPWDVVPRMFFVVFFLAALASFVLAYGSRLVAASATVMTGLTFLSVSAAAFVYSVGFGFDPFIHQATESFIYKMGAIEPKPLYYLGHYSLVTVIARLLGGHVFEIDRWLVPVAAAMAVPCAYYAMRRSFDWQPRIAAAATVVVPLLPLASFIATTPQGLANAFTLMTAFLALPAAVNRAFPRSLLALMALAAVAIHPLAGIPLVFFVAVVIFQMSHEKGRGAHEAGRLLVLGELAVVGALALPAVFFINAAISKATVSINVEMLRAPLDIITGLGSSDLITRRFMAAFDFAYFWRAWRETLLLGTGLFGIVLLARKTRGALAYLIGFFIFGANYVLLKTVLRFSFLIDYERSNYADRLLELSIFLLAPLAAYALGLVLERASKRAPALRIGATVFVAALAVSSLYLAYPRRDLYESSRGWSTGAADVEAVRLINKDASGRDYVALANQSVSAAAIREFGFKKYYGSLFYYPVPTGDALYGKFLEMNDTLGSAETARQVMEMTGSDTIYFVVTNYWWHAQRIIVSAKKQADQWWNVGDTDHVFKYSRQKLAPGRDPGFGACDPLKPGSCG